MSASRYDDLAHPSYSASQRLYLQPPGQQTSGVLEARISPAYSNEANATIAFRLWNATFPEMHEVKGLSNYGDLDLWAVNAAVRIVYAIPTSWPMRFALPRNIWPGWEFAAPAEVLIERDDEGSYIVSEDRTVIYGVGDTPDEAIRDYLIALVEYEQLHEQEARSGDPKAQKQLELIGRYFHPVDNAA